MRKKKRKSKSNAVDKLLEAIEQNVDGIISALMLKGKEGNLQAIKLINEFISEHGQDQEVSLDINSMSAKERNKLQSIIIKRIKEIKRSTAGDKGTNQGT